MVSFPSIPVVRARKAICDVYCTDAKGNTNFGLCDIITECTITFGNTIIHFFLYPPSGTVEVLYLCPA